MVLSASGDRRVFVDTSAYYALADARDNEHSRAIIIAACLARDRWSLTTTNFVVAETHTLILARLGRRIAAEVLEMIDSGPAAIIRGREMDEQRARAIITQYDDKGFSLIDALSFAVMERLQIRQAFTFDRHFAQFGFAPLSANYSE